MRCSRCGANVVEGDRFCENCGAPVAVQAGSGCPGCGQQSEPGMRFCQQCGAELSAGPRPAQPVPTAQPVPAAQPYQAVQQYAGQYGAAQPGAGFPPQAVQASSIRTASSRQMMFLFFMRSILIFCCLPRFRSAATSIPDGSPLRKHPGGMKSCTVFFTIFR